MVALAKSWVNTGKKLSGEENDYLKWDSLRQQLFIQELLDAADSQPLSLATLAALDAEYTLTGKKNSEIRFKWCKLCLACGR